VIDEVLAQEAFRLRALTAVAATTGTAGLGASILSATTLGFARSDGGSFITDGFAVGMEVKGTGFSAANSAPAMIEDRTAGFLTITGGRAVQPAAAGRTLLVNLPQDRMWEGTRLLNPPAPGTRPYIADQWVPGASRVITFSISRGEVEETGFYYLTIYGISNIGKLAIRRYIKSLKTLFTPGTTVMAGSDAVTVRGDPAPKAGQIIPLENGFAYCQFEIPWWARTKNAIAA
jgi:hypothetical protein